MSLTRGIISNLIVIFLWYSELSSCVITTTSHEINYKNDKHSELPFGVSISAVARGLSPHGYTGDRRHLHAALLRAIREKHLRIGVVGDSVPFGHGLQFREEQSWPTRCEKSLQKLLLPVGKNFSVKVVNLAIPAAPSYVQAQFTSEKFWADIASCHIVVVSTSTNDIRKNPIFQHTDVSSNAAEGRHLMRTLLQQLIFRKEPENRSGLIYFETFTKSYRSNASLIHTPLDASNYYSMTLMRNVTIPQTFVSKVSKCPFDVAQFLHWPELVRYLIPVLAWPSIICNHDLGMNKLCDKFPHPSATYHNIMGKVVAFSLYTLFLEAMSVTDDTFRAIKELFESDILRVSQTANKLEKSWAAYISKVVSENTVERLVSSRNDIDEADCDIHERQTVLTAATEGFIPVSHGKNWIFGEDVRGNDKPGWVANNISIDTEGKMKNSLALYSGRKRIGINDRPNYISALIARNEADNHKTKHLKAFPFHDHNSEILFKVITNRNILRISVLHSYTNNMGVLACCVDCDSFKAEQFIDTKWGTKVSLEGSHLIRTGNILNSSQANNTSTLERWLRCRVSHGKKVKIMSIMTC